MNGNQEGRVGEERPRDGPRTETRHHYCLQFIEETKITQSRAIGNWWILDWTLRFVTRFPDFTLLLNNTLVSHVSDRHDQGSFSNTSCFSWNHPAYTLMHWVEFLTMFLTSHGTWFPFLNGNFRDHTKAAQTGFEVWYMESNNHTLSLSLWPSRSPIGTPRQVSSFSYEDSFRHTIFLTFGPLHFA